MDQQQPLEQLTSIKQIGLYKSDKPLVYIAGKVSGLPHEETWNKFLRAELALRKAGYDVINPMVIIRQDCEWNAAMRICLSVLPYADHLHLLADWHLSNGATIEREHARAMGIPLIRI